MAVSYRKLWHLMLDKKVSKNGLERIAAISHYSMLKLSKDQDVSTEVLTKICGALNCEVKDIVDFFPDEGEENQDKETNMHFQKNILN